MVRWVMCPEERPRDLRLSHIQTGRWEMNALEACVSLVHSCIPSFHEPGLALLQGSGRVHPAFIQYTELKCPWAGC